MLLMLVLGMLEVLVVLVVLEVLVVFLEGIFERGPYFFHNYHGPLSLGFSLAGSVGSVSVGKRATFYLNQSSRLCYFLNF